MKTLYIFTTLVVLSISTALAQVQFRGMYIDHFTDILGNTAKEDSLLQYAQDSSFNYLALYDIQAYNLNNANTANTMASFIKKARDVYNITYIGAVGETYSSFRDNIGPYNMNRADDHEKFNVFNLEFEFWTTSSVSPGGYYCDQYLQQANCSCDSSGGFKFYIEQLHKIDSLAHVQQVMSETYLGWFNQGQAQQIQQNVDRILLHAYRTNSSSLWSYSTTRLSYLASNHQSVDIAPIFSAEPVFMSSWLDSHSQADAFNTYQADYTSDNSSWKQYINIIGYQWFDWKYMKKPAPSTVFSPVVTISGASGGNGTLCTNDTATLTATGGDSYHWSNGATTRTIRSSASGTFSCDVTLNGVTKPTPAVTLTQRTSPTVTISAGTTNSNIVPLTADVNAGSGSVGSYQWQINSSDISGAHNASYSAGVSGNYSVQIVNTYGCQTTSAMYSVVIPGSCFAATPSGLNSSQGLDLTQVLSWDAGLTGDSVIIRYHPDTSSTYQYARMANTGQTTYVLNDLIPGILYSWRVKTMCGSTSGAYSSKSYFTTPATVTVKPDLNSDAALNVYPNPAKGKTHVNFLSAANNKGELTLSDMNGRTVLKQQLQLVQGDNTINLILSEYKNGVYTISIKTDTGLSNQKLIIDN
jgi:hypothetical protein